MQLSYAGGTKKYIFKIYMELEEKIFKAGFKRRYRLIRHNIKQNMRIKFKSGQDIQRQT